jgi:hypothetical protein
MSTTTTPIGLGVAPNDGNGDPLRNGGETINANTVKLFNLSNKIDEGKIAVWKYPGNTDITVTVQQNDVVTGIIESAGIKYFIKAQYNTGPDTNFGTIGGFFNDGSYNTISFDELL